MFDSIFTDFFTESDFNSILESIRLDKADLIRCAYTGEVIGSLSEAELGLIVASHVARTGQVAYHLIQDTLLDEIQLALLAINSRPQAAFYNLTQDRYASLVKVAPVSMTRYLAGKLMFEAIVPERERDLTMTLAAKIDWLSEIEAFDPALPANAELLKGLIRLDAVFSVRNVLATESLRTQAKEIRKAWPGIAKFAEFVSAIESANIDLLTRRDVSNNGRLAGNKLAQRAMFDALTELTPEQMADIIAREEALERESEGRRKRIAEQAAKAARGASGGSVVVNRGAKAIISLASMGDTFDKDLALTLAAKLKDAKRVKAAKAIESKLKVKGKAATPAKPKKLKKINFVADSNPTKVAHDLKSAVDMDF